MQIVLTQSFNTVLIRWHSINAAGSVKMNWELPDSMNQETMVEKIMLDIVTKQQENIMKKVNKAMRDEGFM
jgi:hypothetical protein